jgi:hypothetical protein
MNFQAFKKRGSRAEVRAGFPASRIPVLTDALAVYRPEQLPALRESRALRLWNGDLRRIPPAVWSMTDLETLDLSGNPRLEEVSAAIGGLGGLRHLVLDSCTGLQRLPSSIRGLARLETLDLGRCTALVELPEGLLDALPSLRRLDLRGCTALRRAPRGRESDVDLLVLLPEHLMRSRARPARLAELVRHPAARPRHTAWHDVGVRARRTLATAAQALLARDWHAA